jgi:hypothetical protein
VYALMFVQAILGTEYLIAHITAKGLLPIMYLLMFPQTQVFGE